MSMNFCCPRFNTLVVSQSGCKYTSLFFSHPNLLPTFFEEKLTREITCWKPTHCQRQKKGGNKITIFSPSHQRLLIIFFSTPKRVGLGKIKLKRRSLVLQSLVSKCALKDFFNQIIFTYCHGIKLRL
jgi:hypothetical protein